MVRTLELQDFEGTSVRLFVSPREWLEWRELATEIGTDPLALPVPDGTDPTQMAAELDAAWEAQWRRAVADLPVALPGWFQVSLPLDATGTSAPLRDGDLVLLIDPGRPALLDAAGLGDPGRVPRVIESRVLEGWEGGVGHVLGPCRPLGLLHLPTPAAGRHAAGAAGEPAGGSHPRRLRGRRTGGGRERGVQAVRSLCGHGRGRAVLVVAGGDRTRLDTGSVALALARRLAESGRTVLFVDADTTGSRLAARCGGAIGAPFSPATRGLPTLIAARDPLEAEALAAHCYSLSAGAESLWLLFAPDSAAGGCFARGLGWPSASPNSANSTGRGRWSSLCRRGSSTRRSCRC